MADMIRDVSETLVDVVHQATPDLGAWAVLSSLSAADADPAANKLAVALYAVEEHPHMRNRPLVSTPDGYVRPPLPLLLRYLMTFTGPHDEAQTRLARVIAAFHTFPILPQSRLTPALAAVVKTITVRLVTTTADERNQIWGALGRSARLALFYEVDVAPIDLLSKDGAGTVTEHRVEYVSVP